MSGEFQHIFNDMINQSFKHESFNQIMTSNKKTVKTHTYFVLICKFSVICLTRVNIVKL